MRDAVWFVAWCCGAWIAGLRKPRTIPGDYRRREYKSLTQRMGASLTDAGRDRLRGRWLRVRS